MESLSCRYCGARLDRPGGKCSHCGHYADDASSEPADPFDDPKMEAFRRRIHQATPRIWMTYVLIGLVCVGYLWQILLTGRVMSFTLPGLIAAGANFGPLTLNGEWWRLISCIFLHGSLLHIAMNMYCFYSFGPLVERLVGNWGMLVLFIVSGLFGSITSVNWSPNATSIGASGAVFGVAGALLGYLLHQRRQIPAALFSELTNSTATFVVLNVILAATIPHIDQAAHIGGLAGGFVIGLIQGSDSSPASLAWRPFRNGLVAILGVVAFVAVTQFHRAPGFKPQAQAAQANDPAKELTDIEQERVRIEEVARALIRGNETNEADESAIVRLKRDVLEPWQKIRERMAALRSHSANVDRALSGIADYYAKREASWRLLVEFFKTADRKKFTEFEAATAEADRAFEALNKQASKKASDEA